MTSLTSPLSSYLAATCLYAAFGLPFAMGLARMQTRAAPIPAPTPTALPVPRR